MTSEARGNVICPSRTYFAFDIGNNSGFIPTTFGLSGFTPVLATGGPSRPRISESGFGLPDFGRQGVDVYYTSARLHTLPSLSFYSLRLHQPFSNDIHLLRSFSHFRLLSYTCPVYMLYATILIYNAMPSLVLNPCLSEMTHLFRSLGYES